MWFLRTTYLMLVYPQGYVYPRLKTAEW
jgi:hypothetical protein